MLNIYTTLSSQVIEPQQKVISTFQAIQPQHEESPIAWKKIQPLIKNTSYLTHVVSKPHEEEFL